jgi:hypothetical protein
VDEVVGHRRARTFVVDQLAGQRHGTIDDLHDARLVHLLFHVRDRGDWINNPKGVPPEGFTLAKAAIDVDAL